ncbi:MAG: hypothetical protein VKO39_14170 [Cyanobacteriota bacterium]|nr:hypothetical protein [Cyanobacteriota bacterium]
MPATVFTAIALGLVSTVASGVALVAILLAQRVAQRPAFEGVMVVHLSQGGELRLWHQPIRPQDMPVLLERALARTAPATPLVVRLVPEPEVPWGVVTVMLQRLRPPAGQGSWTLQLQLP